jgi:hypothetical protein
MTRERSAPRIVAIEHAEQNRSTRAPLLVNAAHIKQVPGRKTDVKDWVWIAQLLEHGRLRGSFVPPAPIRDLRDLTRYSEGGDP